VAVIRRIKATTLVGNHPPVMIIQGKADYNEFTRIKITCLWRLPRLPEVPDVARLAIYKEPAAAADPGLDKDKESRQS